MRQPEHSRARRHAAVLTACSSLCVVNSGVRCFTRGLARCGEQAGLEPLCRALFLSAAKLADSLNLLYKKYEPDDGAVLPEELAAAHVAEARARPRCPYRLGQVLRSVGI